MRKNKMLRLASALLILVLLTTSAVGGTFAKYTSNATATDTARVAKWKINYTDKVNNEQVDIVGNSTVRFDLFNTVTDDDANAITVGNDDSNVANGTGEMIIAPGTGGKFVMNIENASEVTAKYTIVLSETQTNVETDQEIPIEYSLDNTNWTKNISDLNSNVELLKGISLDMNSNKDVTVYWRWAFEDTTDTDRDAKDTALGEKAATAGSEPKVTVTASITVEQVD